MKKLITGCIVSVFRSFVLVSLALVSLLPLFGCIVWAKSLADSSVYLPAIFVLLGGLSLSSYLLDVVFRGRKE
jgi:hypothetical protein